MSEGRLLHLRCFLEGVEVPIISCSVSAAIGGPASAHIELLDSELGFNLLPRTFVHVFFYDDEKGGTANTTLNGSTSSKSYKLLFCGELFSIFHNKSAYGNRSLTIMCLDFSNVLDTHYIFQVGYSDASGLAGVGDQATAQFIAGNKIGNNPFDNIVNSPQLVIQQMAEKQASSPTHSRRQSRLGNLFAIFELLLGVEGHALGMNIWISIHERMARLMDMIDSDDGSTSKKIFDNQVFTNWVKNTINSQNPSMSYRELLKMIMDFIYYDMVPIPTASYFRPGGKEGGRDKFEVMKQTRTVPHDYLQYFGVPDSDGNVGPDAHAEWRDSKNMEPGFLKSVTEIVQALRDKGWNLVYITDGYRNSREAQALYKRSDFVSPHMRGVAADVSGGVGLPQDFLFSMGNVALSAGRTLSGDTSILDSLVADEYAFKSGDAIKTTDARIMQFFLDREDKVPSKEWNTKSDIMEEALFSDGIQNAFQFLNYMLVYPLFSRVKSICPAAHRYIDKCIAGTLEEFWKEKWADGSLMHYHIFGRSLGWSLWNGMSMTDKAHIWVLDWVNGNDRKKAFFKKNAFTSSNVEVPGWSDKGKEGVFLSSASTLGGLGQKNMWTQAKETLDDDEFPEDATEEEKAALRKKKKEAAKAMVTSNTIGNKNEAVAFAKIWKDYYDKKVELWTDLSKEVAKHRGLFTGAARSVLSRGSPLFYIFGIPGDDPVHIQLNDSGDYTAESVVRSQAEAEAQYNERERLTGFILRPDIWMCAPPRCNVIFPEDTISLNISRELMRQTSRAFLMTYDELYADNVIFNGHYFAPQFEGDIPNIQQIAFGNSTANEVLYPHEAYTGIIPKVSRMSEVAFYARKKDVDEDARDLSEDRQFFNSLQGLSEDAQLQQIERAGTEGVTGVVRAYASNVAHFNLIKQRYSSNRIAITARFLPRLIPGLPAVVIGNKLSSSKLGFQSTHTWLGMIESIQHSYSQGGANTSVSLSTCRPYKTGPDSVDELLRLKKPGQNLFTNQSYSYITDPIEGEETVEPVDFYNERDVVGGSLSEGSDLSDGMVSHLNDEGLLILDQPMPASGAYDFLVKALRNSIPHTSLLGTRRGGGYTEKFDGYFGRGVLALGNYSSGTKRLGGEAVEHFNGIKAITGTDSVVKAEINVSRVLVSYIIERVGATGDNPSEPTTQRTILENNEVITNQQVETMLQAAEDNNVLINASGEFKKIADLKPDRVSGPCLAIVTYKWSMWPEADPGVSGVDSSFSSPNSTTIKAIPGAKIGSATFYSRAIITCDIKVTGEATLSIPVLITTPEFSVALGSQAQPQPSTAQTSGLGIGIPLEEALMPPWIDDAYKNGEIDIEEFLKKESSTITSDTGIGSLYRRWFGCSSIVDGVPYTLKQESDSSNTVDIEKAVNKIIYWYANEGVKPPIPLKEYTQRNIATLNDMLGSIKSQEKNKKEIPKSGGFHSRSVGGHDSLDLLGIAGVTLKGSIASDKTVSLNPLSQQEKDKGLVLDPRPERYNRVILYKNDVTKTRGKLG